jgi:hypothetical protein
VAVFGGKLVGETRRYAQHQAGHHTRLSDIQLMLSGCQNCWTFGFLEGLELIGFVQGNQWRPGSPEVTVDTVRGLQITKALVMAAVLQFQAVH